MIALKEALIIHELAIEKFGGSFGVRDINLLESAIQIPNATFGGNNLYPREIDNAAAIVESIV